MNLLPPFSGYPECKRSNQNYWGFGLFPSSGILKTREHNVSEIGYVSILR
jgi:hypothetical protein